MLAIVMEDEMRDLRKWHGNVGYFLGAQLSMTLTSDVSDDFNKSVRDIAEQIDRNLVNALSNEQQVAASLMSALRLPSPSPSDTQSGTSTPLQTQGVLKQSVVGMHVDGDVQTFRKDMEKFIRDFRAGSSEQHREWQLWQLLLVGFVRNLVAPSYADSDSEDLGNLKWWRKRCNTPDTSLMQHFQKLMGELKPAIWTEMMKTYNFTGAGKQDQSTVAAIDWIVQHSEWALHGALQKEEWRTVVVMQWFEQGNTEQAVCFLERAEKFLGTEKGEKWGMTILGKVIETKSYVVFFRMEALASILLHEHCCLYIEKVTRLNSHQVGDGGSDGSGKMREGHGGGSASLLPITMLVSSANWHLSIDHAGYTHVSMRIYACLFDQSIKEQLIRFLSSHRDRSL